MRAAVTSVLIEPRLCWQVPKLDNWTRMLKQWIKQIIPARYRPYLLKFLSFYIRAADLPAAIRLKLTDRSRIVAANLARRDQRIVFVSEKPSWREAKLAFGLKSAGWDVIQLHRYAATGGTDDYAEMQKFTTPSEAVTLADKVGARLFHTFAPSCDATMLHMVRHKPGRVMVDFYDNLFSVSHGLPEIEKKFAIDIAMQEYCLNNADAIVTRDLQLQYHRKYRDVGRDRPLILFPEYCWNRQPLPTPRNDKEIHVVQIGWMGFERRGEVDDGCFFVVRAFVEAGCHFHIYLHPTFPALGTMLFKSLFQDYLALGEQTGRVHIHATVQSDQIVEKISRYDFGFNMKNALTFEKIPLVHANLQGLPYNGSGRLFDYLDAGLGLLVDSALRFMHHTFRGRGVIFDGTALIKNGLTNLSKPDAASILAARQKLGVTQNIGRLTHFYGQLG
jgi:hypothetical protein